MGNVLCTLFTLGILGAVLLVVVLIFVSLFLLTPPRPPQNLVAAKDEIRRIGEQARRQMNQTAEAYQAEAANITNRKG